MDPNRGLTVDSYTFAVEAAVQGEGVVLDRTMLVTDDLAAGRLVRPFKHALKACSCFFVVYPQCANRQRKVKAFRDWLFFGVRLKTIILEVGQRPGGDFASYGGPTP